LIVTPFDGTKIYLNVKTKEEFLDWFDKNNQYIKELKRKLEKYEGETGQLYGARYYIPYEDKYNEMIKTYVNRIESFCNKSMFKRIMCAIKKNI